MGNLTAMVATVTFWGAIVAIVVIPMYFKHRERLRLHDVLKTAFENGQPVPPELVTALQSRVAEGPQIATPERDLRRGIVLVAVGLGLAALGYGLWYGLMSVNDISADITGGCVAGAGAIPGLIGVAYLLLWATRRRAPRA